MNVHVMHGRFQPFHNGHLAYAIEAADGCDLLVVGLTRVGALQDSSPEIPDLAAPHRFDPSSNPMTFAERALVIEATLSVAEAIRCPVIFVPFPIERPELIPLFIPKEWLIVTTLHEAWNEKKVEILTDLGYEISIVCESEEKVIRGQDIRKAMRRSDLLWRKLVPTEAAAMLDQIGIPERLASS
jgi:nicotinamide-nucleotide adenylyltransferase